MTALAVEAVGGLVITGRDARDIDSHVRTFVKPAHFWTEVQGMRECAHGCKLHVRRRGAVLQYAIYHSASYGCSLGREAATRWVPVSVRPAVTS